MTIEIRDASLEASIRKQLQATGSSCAGGPSLPLIYSFELRKL